LLPRCSTRINSDGRTSHIFNDPATRSRFEGNKHALFDTLVAANITEAHDDFDGEGDSGQIDSVIALRGEDRAELPKTTGQNPADLMARHQGHHHPGDS